VQRESDEEEVQMHVAELIRVREKHFDGLMEQLAS
jgi:hypothetical protein